MELARTEQSLYFPPVLVGALFAYHSWFGGILTEHPILKSYAVLKVVYDTLLHTLMTFVNTTHAKALVVKHSLTTTLNMTLVNMYSMMTRLNQSITSFSTRAGAFFAPIKAFFVPPSAPPVLDTLYIGAIIGLSLLVVGFTVYILSTNQMKVIEPPVPVPATIRRNPVRRKAIVT